MKHLIATIMVGSALVISGAYAKDAADLATEDVAIAKGNLCNSGGYHCVGEVSELISQFYTIERSSTVNLYLTPELIAEIGCAPQSGVLLPLPGEDAGQQTVISQLSLALGLGARIALRIDQGSDPCTLTYMRVYTDSVSY